MTEKTEALRLAAALETAEISYTSMVKAAAELRRLHAENERLWFENGDLRRCSQLEEVERYAAANRKYAAQRDALLEACRAMLTFIERHAPRGLQPEPGSPVAMARAAIAKAEEKT